jgi:hypothetical protein
LLIRETLACRTKMKRNPIDLKSFPKKNTART